MNYLKQKLEEKHITQEELAFRLDLSTATINRYINGKLKRGMPIDVVYDMSIVLDIPLDEFVKGIMGNGKN